MAAALPHDAINKLLTLDAQIRALRVAASYQDGFGKTSRALDTIRRAVERRYEAMAADLARQCQ